MPLLREARKDTRTRQERQADRKRLYEILQQAGVQMESVEDAQELFKDMVAMTLENGLEGELLFHRPLSFYRTVSVFYETDVHYEDTYIVNRRILRYNLEKRQ